jgi:hypothetical protein
VVEVKEVKWWLRRRTLVCGAIAAVLLTAAIFVLIRWRSNVVLAKELRAEIETWLQTLPKIPDSENGMLPILSGLEAFKDSLPERLNAKDFSVENESDKALLKQYLTEKEEPLAQIYKGLSFSKFLFPGDYRKGYLRGTLRLVRLQNPARLLELKGNLLESEGKKSEALNEYLNILRLGETLSSERVIISRMIEGSVLDRAFEALTCMLSERSVGEKDISAALRSLIDQHGERGNFFTMIDAEYYFFLILVANLIEGRTNFWEGISSRPGNETPLALRIVMSKYFYDYCYDVGICRKAAEIWRRTDPAEYYALPLEAKNYDETLLKKVRLPAIRGFALTTCLPALRECVKTLAASETLWRGAIALAGVRLFEARNGRLPKNLQELGKLVPEEFLTDPFSGKEIIYRLEGNDFCLYSVGSDGVDGNPVSVLPYFKEKKSAYDLPDIIFHAPPAGKGG